jgi:hypothetical protein
MASILGKITGLDTIREEMKQRVNEILKCGNEWKLTAEKLNETLQKLIETIEKGSSVDLNPVKSDLKKLSVQTGKLAKAFEAHRKTLSNLTEKLL